MKDVKTDGIKLATEAFDWVVCGENQHWKQDNGKLPEVLEEIFHCRLATVSERPIGMEQAYLRPV